MTPRTQPHSPRLWWPVVGLLIVAVAIAAWRRGGLLDLPSVPAGLTLEASGLANLEQMKQLNASVWAETPPAPTEAAAQVRQGITACRHGDITNGLERMQAGLRLAPNDLVLANAYRMVVFGLRRDFLAAARRNGLVAPKFPPALDRQPLALFEELDRRRPTREIRLDLALSWVDEMLLFPALEIKAPASVQAVDFLTGVIEHGNPGYVPALFARGLNHLHRPARLVWPESNRTPPDAAVQDIGRCVAIGRRFGVGTPRLQATLALTLGDAYVKTGRLSVARSWWQIAQNLCHDEDLQSAIRRRYSWPNETALDQLEAELDRARSALDRPMTDLALMWN